jgi:predicted GNAT family acetyltransferase
MKLIDPATGQAVWDSNDPNAGPVPPAPEGRQWVRVDEPGDTMAPRRTAPGILDIGNGVTERLAFLNQTFNPVEGIGSAMRAGSRMLAPDQSYWDRIASLGEMVSGVASIAAPIAAAKAIGVPAASAMMEGLLGFSPARQAAGDMATQFARSESGALPGGGPGRPPLTFDDVARAMQEEQPVNLGQFRQERARQDLISKVKGAIEDVSSGAYQARLDENAFELHKSGNLPLRVGTRVSPPSTYEMGSDLRVSGYWVDQQNPNIFGYKLQNEAGQEFTEFVSNPRLGLVPTAADRFGGGFKAFAGPNADQRLGFKAPETPTAAARPSSSPEIDAEFEALFGAGTERAPLDVSRRDASNIFGEGSERVRYTDPQSGGTIEVVVRPDGSASVLELEVPEASRGQGIGQTLQERVMQDFPMMGGQVSSKAAATTAYRLGRRPPGKPDATLEEVFADIDEMSSVNMVSPAMQERLAPAAPALPTPRNEAEAMARDILQLRAEGRAGEVTDQMRAAADPQYMYLNTPLPMDYASRMARADQYFPDTAYHSTGKDFQKFIPSEFRGASFFGPTPEGAARGASASANEGVGSGSKITMPVRVDTSRVEGLGAYGRQDMNEFRASLPDRIYTEAEVDALMASDMAPRYGNWTYFFDDLTDYDALTKFRDANPDAPIPEGIIKYRPKQPLSYGPNLRSDISGKQFAHYSEGMSERPISDYTKSIGNTGFTMQDESGLALAMTDPTRIRSRFALFDPEFRHLRNLSAGVGGAAVLTALGDDAEAGTPETQIMDLVKQSGVSGAAQILGVSRRDIEEAISIAVPPSQWDQLVVGPQ